MYQEPLVTLVALHHTPYATQFVVQLAVVPTPPLAPASLHAVDPPHVRVVEFHTVVAQTQHEITFATFRAPSTFPALGQAYILRTWWTPD